MDFASQYGGSYAADADPSLREGDRGTSVVELVVSSQLTAMRDDGTYDSIYNAAIAAGD